MQLTAGRSNFYTPLDAPISIYFVHLFTCTVAFGDQAIATNNLSLILRLFPDTTRKVTISLMIIAMVSRPKAFPESEGHNRGFNCSFSLHHRMIKGTKTTWKKEA